MREFFYFVSYLFSRSICLIPCAMRGAFNFKTKTYEHKINQPKSEFQFKFAPRTLAERIGSISFLFSQTYTLIRSYRVMAICELIGMFITRYD